MTIKTADFKQFAWNNFVINKVYPAYRSGCIDLWADKKVWRYVFRTFKTFPKVEEEILVGGLRADGSKLTKEMEASLGKELREQKWENWVANFYKIKDKMDKDFYKTWGKVFDMEIELEKPIEVLKYKTKSWEIVSEDWNIINLTWISAWKIKSMIRSLVEEDIPLVDWKDKAWNPAKVEEYDFEDTWKDKLEGKFVKMKVSWSWMDTKYIFNEGKTFLKEEPIKDTPFTSDEDLDKLFS